MVTLDLRDILLVTSCLPDGCLMLELSLVWVTQLLDLLVSAPALASFTLGAPRPDNTGNDGHYHTGIMTTQ